MHDNTAQNESSNSEMADGVLFHTIWTTENVLFMSLKVILLTLWIVPGSDLVSKTDVFSLSSSTTECAPMCGKSCPTSHIVQFTLIAFALLPIFRILRLWKGWWMDIFSEMCTRANI